MYISVGKVGRGPGGRAYYVRTKRHEAGIPARDDHGGPSGRWFGRLAAELGLVGPVEPGAFRSLHVGFSPAGQPLSRNPRHPRRRPAYDLTHALVKDASILASVDSEWVRRICEEVATPAVDASLRYLEAEGCWTRRGRNGADRVRGDGFVGAAFFHQASRPSRGGVGDPHLHRHCVIFNTTRGPDGRWTALDGGPLYRLAKSAAALASVEEAYLLEQIGFQVRRSGRTFRVVGLADPLREACSRRSREIRAEAGEGASPGSRDRANRATRGRGRDPETDRVTAIWRARNERHGLTPDRVERLARLGPARVEAAAELAVVSRAAVREVAWHDVLAPCDLLERVALDCLCRGGRASEVRLQVCAELEQGRRGTPGARLLSPSGPDGAGQVASVRPKISRADGRDVVIHAGPGVERVRGRAGEGGVMAGANAADPGVWAGVEGLLRRGPALVDREVAGAQRRLVDLWSCDPTPPELRIILASTDAQARAINAICQRWTLDRRPEGGAGVAVRGGGIFPGDRIVCLRKASRYDVSAGEMGVVLAADADRDRIRVALDHAGRVVTLPIAAYARDHLALGFAVRSLGARCRPVATAYLFVHGRITPAQARCLVGGNHRVACVLATTWGDLQAGRSNRALHGRPPIAAAERAVRTSPDPSPAVSLWWGRERQR